MNDQLETFLGASESQKESGTFFMLVIVVIRRALTITQNIAFYRYQVSSKLVKI